MNQTGGMISEKLNAVQQDMTDKLDVIVESIEGRYLQEFHKLFFRTWKFYIEFFHKFFVWVADLHTLFDRFD